MAGKEATQNAIIKLEKEKKIEESKATENFAVRLSAKDAEIIRDVMRRLFEQRKKTVTASDSIRVALRSLSDQAKKDPLSYL